MPRRTENLNVEATPHFDGEKENIINDPTASGSTKMGIQLDTKEEFAEERDPLKSFPERDKELKQFEKLMRGKKIDN
ncbi:hypothetical protein [Paenisporosarcina sp. TG20]|uniref:hypothetical protein n=1 Tax=Paenisporosarcina sp. TG20 TaxID=1211706 RepID=UPI00031B6BEA|nr:hypothetical protein [Paenisporosarcina sp. TG20]